MPDRLRVTVIGAGAHAHSAHFPALAELGDVERAAVCDIDEARAQGAAAKWGFGRAYTDYSEMLDREKPDAVFLIVLPQHVFPIAADILRRRIPLLTEKPPGLSAYQTGALAAIAEDAKALNFVAFNRRSTPTLVEAKRRMEARGPIDHFVITYSKFAGKRTRPYFDGIVDILMVDAIHAVDMARWLGGEPEAVSAVTRVSRRDQDAKYVALLRFPGGRTGFLNCVWTSGKRTHEVQMHGNDACAFVEVEREMRFVREGGQAEVASAVELAGGSGNHYVAGFVAQARTFLDCVRKGQRPANDLSDAVRSMELAERLYRETL